MATNDNDVENFAAEAWLDNANVAKLLGNLPTKGQAHLDLVNAARLFAGRQTTERFEALSRALAVARALKIY